MPNKLHLIARRLTPHERQHSTNWRTRMIKPRSVAIFVFLTFGSVCASKENTGPVVTSVQAQDGVFVLSNGYQETIIELKKGKFRYWHSSDVVVAAPSSYPIAGKYTSNGASIKLLSDKVGPYHMNWTFKKINNTVTIWADFAIETYEKSKELHTYGILRLTSKTAEQALKDHSY